MGGANIIAHPKYKIKCKRKIGCDINNYLISFLKKIKEGNIEYIDVSKEEYIKVKENKQSYDEWYVGYVGFMFSYAGRFFDSYINVFTDKNGKTRIYGKERFNNVMKQKESLNEVIFGVKDFNSVDIDRFTEKDLIYIDPPYFTSTRKHYKDDELDYDLFWEKVRKLSNKCVVLVSEHCAPSDFKDLLNIDLMQQCNKAGNRQTKTEKVFILKNNKFGV